jgi:hypothetical protein
MNNNFIGGNFEHAYDPLTGGAVDELRIWDVARTTAEIAANFDRDMNPPSPAVFPADLEDYYTFNATPPVASILDEGQAPANNLVLIGTPVPDLVSSCADVYTDPPCCFTLISPADGAVEVDGCQEGYCILFEWDAALHMTNYPGSFYA